MLLKSKSLLFGPLSLSKFVTRVRQRFNLTGARDVSIINIQTTTSSSKNCNTTRTSFSGHVLSYTILERKGLIKQRGLRNHDDRRPRRSQGDFDKHSRCRGSLDKQSRSQSDFYNIVSILETAKMTETLCNFCIHYSSQGDYDETAHSNTAISIIPHYCLTRNRRNHLLSHDSIGSTRICHYPQQSVRRPDPATVSQCSQRPYTYGLDVSWR